MRAAEVGALVTNILTPLAAKCRAGPGRPTISTGAEKPKAWT